LKIETFDHLKMEADKGLFAISAFSDFQISLL